MTYIALFMTGALGSLAVACVLTSGVPGTSFMIVALPLLVALTPCSLAAIATWMVLLYKAWAAIQDGHARATPDAAVFLLFVPVYNIYWVFQAVVGFAYDYNSLARRHHIGDVRMDVPLCHGWCVCVALTLVPYVALGTGLCVVALTPLLMADMCDAINAVAEASA